MGKKIAKAVKKVVKEITRPVKQVAGALAGAPDMPDIDPSAALVEVPQQEEVQTDTSVDTAASRKKAQSGGKKSLSVARSAGGGINI